MTADRTDVDRLLAGAAEHLASTDGDAHPPEELRDLADEANDLVSGAEPSDLLAAVGAEADGDDPSTVPEAIMQSPEEVVVDLRALLALSRLSESWGEAEADTHLSTLRELLDSGDSDRATEGAEADDAERSPDDESGRSGDGAEADGAEEPAGDGEEEGALESLGNEIESRLTESEPSSDAESAGAADATADDDGGVATTLADDFESALNESLAEFLGRESAVDEAVSEAVDDEREETESRDEDAEQEADERRDRIGGPGGPFSTVPSSDRADMGRATRFSTLRAELRRRKEEVTEETEETERD